MKKLKIYGFVFLLSFIVGSHSLWADSHLSNRTHPKPPPKERDVTTHHTVIIDGKTIPYTATAGTIFLRDEKQKPIASVFFVAYTRDDIKDVSKRPITFAYNGGPGSSSVWLQLGGVGPRRIATTDAVFTPPPPYHLENNPYSILDKTDLVFIDPVGTGFSHPIGKFKPKEFWSVDGDAKSLAQFIERYLTKFNRWNSPKFLLGESYGTTRSAVLAYDLQDDGVQLNGVILISSILNFETAAFTPGNDLPYILFLPTYAAVAWYHHKVSGFKDLQSLLSRVESFAVGPYASALMKGDALSQQTERSLAKQLADYTGVSESFWEKAKLRITGPEFEKILLAREGKMTGRLDARFTGYATEEVLPFRDYAVMDAAIRGAFTAVMNHYLQNELKYKSTRQYAIFGDVYKVWSWKHKPPGFTWEDWEDFLNVSPDLMMAMTMNPHLQVMVNNGYFDLGTPFYATLYTFNHLGLPKPLEKNLHIYNYNSGHMIYLHTPSLKELYNNIDHFIELSSP
jgi:carboxypeptidase C (cathepsin A)